MVNAAADATRPDPGSLLVVAVALIRSVRRACPDGATYGAACDAVSEAWPLVTLEDVTGLAAWLVALAAAGATDAQLARALDIAGRLT